MVEMIKLAMPAIAATTAAIAAITALVAAIFCVLACFPASAKVSRSRFSFSRWVYNCIAARFVASDKESSRIKVLPLESSNV